MRDQKSTNERPSRRDFIRQSALAGAGLLLAGPVSTLAGTAPYVMAPTIKTRGYAAHDTTGKLSLWEFERKPVGENDILIDVRYASICHSDIHQMKGHWGKQQYPQVPGHEIVGIVAAVGKNVTKFKVGDCAGVGCMVDSTCLHCNTCNHGEEQYCENGGTIFTYGNPDKSSPTGISQGGYSTKIVVRDHFAVHIPENINLQDAAPLLCAGITTYSPLMKAKFNRGDKVGVIGIGGLGHLAIKLAVSKGADVYAFTTSPDKVRDILAFGAKEAIVVDSISKLKPYQKTLDYIVSTVPYEYDAAAYAAVLKAGGSFTQLGMPLNYSLNINMLQLANDRINLNASLIGGIPETQEVVNYCADNKILPQIQLIKAEQINDAWQSVVDKKARYRYVIDAATI